MRPQWEQGGSHLMQRGFSNLWTTISSENQRKTAIQKLQELDVVFKSLASTVYFWTPSTPLWPSVRSQTLRRCWNHWWASCVASQFYPHPAEQKKVIVLARFVELKTLKDQLSWWLSAAFVCQTVPSVHETRDIKQCFSFSGSSYAEEDAG